ncbi:serine carboxypeptidase [Dacryopinax primogenitus]|uniref:Carboxypeptidase n=1 Tax=Dacryopinax primogenitus (strain DJM 731) TaxID=1858805 RepID=M5G744_DACPD|nr:serine carboxypeptidase [Dacryopinax primogenitus]EJU04544.1 serine carboxypeptidase [Dacryopinax primogenitus]
MHWFTLTSLTALLPLVGAAVTFPASHQAVFEKERRLSELSALDFVTLSHPSYPAHSVRIKRTEGFCDTTVNTYTGYIDVDYGAKHLWFYFFESRHNPDKDDVIMWINGGPGCSSATGLFMELGPCLINPEGTGENRTKYNPYGWNEVANIFFLDQPVGVGYSYADFGETVSTSEDAAKNVQAFIVIFFETFKQFQGRAFHMAGESYGGRYLPIFASEVYDANLRAESEGFTPVNLQSVMIGNGVTDGPTLLTSFYDIQCTTASLKPFQPIGLCTQMRQAVDKCDEWMMQDCFHRQDAISCQAAMTYCRSALHAPIIEAGRNPYDVSKMCEGGIGDSLCYPVTKKIAAYLSDPITKSLIGSTEFSGNFSSCSPEVMKGFVGHFDSLHLIRYYVVGLLERGINMLFYAGTYDAQCNWVANKRYTSLLDWHGKEQFNALPSRGWNVDGKEAGVARSYKELTFATIYGAGHMVPTDKPAEALEMVKRWLKDRKL